MKSDEFLRNLHQTLLHTRKIVCESALRHDVETCVEVMGDGNKEVERLFEIQNNLVKNGALPPLPELQFFIRALDERYTYDNDMPLLALKLLYRIPHSLSYRRDYLRHLFEIHDVFEACHCLTLTRLQPTRVAPQQESLQKIDEFEDGYGRDTDFICDKCGTKWRLAQGWGEDNNSYNWVLLESVSSEVDLAEHDKYGKALAESRSEVALTTKMLQKALNEAFPIDNPGDENYRSLLKMLAESGIADIKSLTINLSGTLANSSQRESPKWNSHRQLVGEMLRLLYEREGAKWLID